MLDFLMISYRSTKKDKVEIYPKFIIKKSKDLMIRGGDFYAIWIEERGLWSTDEQDALHLIDEALGSYAKENKDKFDSGIRVSYMWDAESGMIDTWHKYCQRQMRDSFQTLDEHLVFANTETTRKEFASKKLEYALGKGDMVAYSRLVSVLYSAEERHKLEWAIGAVVSGASKKIQKFLVLYGGPGTGKSTILDIIQQLFEGYYAVFDARALGSSSNTFALEAFKSNPLVAIQHDGDLSRIEDNTRLNSLVSHEMMTVNEKFKSTYANKFKCFLFMGTNKPVKITDSKSGLIRRLIDVSPSGNTVSQAEYKRLVKQVSFELGAIAYHCNEVYLEDPSKYDDYVPITMLSASNDFYNYMIELYYSFGKEDGVTLKSAWENYKSYCDEAKVAYPHPQRLFKEELKTYFLTYNERFVLEDGTRVRSYYNGFKVGRIDPTQEEPKKEKKKDSKKKTINLVSDIPSVFDLECGDCISQYASAKETPAKKWDEVKTTLSKIDTSRVHYVRVQENHVVIDFDCRDSEGNKSLEKCIEEAIKWPPTYSEVSKGGNGLHLHYIYTGDISKVSMVYDDHIEIKMAIGNSSLRRKLTLCNDLPIATISSGLPLKGEKMVNTDSIKNEKQLRSMIAKNLRKEIHAGTKPSIDFINFLLDEAYASGISYDVSNMKNSVLAFAAESTNQSALCMKIVSDMKFKSDENSVAKMSFDISAEKSDARVMVVFDVEVFPNLFICNWKALGPQNKVVRMINPTPTEIEGILGFNLIGFNCRRYDNHIVYARLMGYTNEQLYNLSQKIINDGTGFFGEAYNLSYTDVYDFSSAGNKKGLKKWEIELGLKHHELGLPWDQPVPEELWLTVAEYCDDDVIATEEVFYHLKSDWTARQILANIAGMTVNDTTNTLTTRIVFGNDRKPQSQFNYRFMGDPTVKVERVKFDNGTIYTEFGDEYTVFDSEGRPIFPGYKFEGGKSTYRGEEVGEGGEVFGLPGIYGNVALLDVESMHPASMRAEVLFGPKYTARFGEIVDGRLDIKHGELESAKKALDGKLAEYLNSDQYTPDDLGNALKTPINSAYGLTSATFGNAFRDPRNKDNIVAKRGALFMINLRHEVESRGFIVAHIKTDSIKIPDATPEIIKFVSDYGKQYGYTFEHEATYEKICLVNDAVYIAKYASVEDCMKLYGYTPKKNKKFPKEWTATGTQFAVPYVHKKLFTKEDIVFEDLCEVKTVQTALHLDMNEGLPDVSHFEKERDKILKKDPTSDVEDLNLRIATGHSYQFVGRVGQFCPIKPGCGGGLLMRETLNKKTGEKSYAAASGTKGYRWQESQVIKELDKVDNIDKSYYDAMVDDAVKTISEYGDYEWFVSDDPYIKKEVGFVSLEYMDPPCKTKKYKSCEKGCPSYVYESGQGHICTDGYEILPF